MRHLEKFAIAAVFACGVRTASADECSGKDHYVGTAVGAVGGGLLAGLASKNVAVGLGGAVLGGFAGNATERAIDCKKTQKKKALKIHRAD